MSRLIVAASESCPDMLYATGFFAPDPFLFLEHKGRTMAVLSDLEIDRGRACAKVDEIVSYSEIMDSRGAGFNELIIAFLKKKRVRKVAVPSSFPLGTARALEKAGIVLQPVSGLFYKEREFKSAEELRNISKALRITEAGMARAMEVLRDASLGKILRWAGKPLTSEVLRSEIDSAVIRAGGQPAHTIVAGGLQACDPHERGHGPLRPHSLIIIDIFPRDPRTGFYGDMTRTVVRGTATEDQRKLWDTVRKGQLLALAGIKPGVDGWPLHQKVKDFFIAQGYPTQMKNGRWTGFFHGTGHGLGLEIHEEPRFAATKFRPGQVITVEPGLYYPQIGGVRIEDVVTITSSGYRMLSKFPKELQIG